ncbi:retrotransposable element [Pimephales promelas]|nr:retrotransposable element [Pimephales promelas]
MERAGDHPIQAAVEMQGALLGRHDEELTSARRAVDSLSAQVADLSQQLHVIRLEVTRSVNPELPEPRVNNPPCYAGEPTECLPFLTQCKVVFSLQPTTYDRERSRIAYVISLLKGRAREWGTAVWNAEGECLSHYSRFREEMLRVFDRSVHGPEASRALSSLRQGRRTVSDFSVEFRTLATSCGWNEPALVARFTEGLNAEIRDEVLAREVPTSLNLLMDSPLRVEKRFELRQRARHSSNMPSPVNFVNAPLSPPDSEPMQLGGIRISATERQRRIINRLCLYCDPLPRSRTTLPVSLRWARSSATCSALIDSGAEGNFMDRDWALEQGIPLVDLQDPFSVFALDGSVLAQVCCTTAPEDPGDLTGVPEEYFDLRAVFSRSRAASLPPNRPYDCKRKALEKYLSESLNAGLIAPSTSPAGAGFFFVKKKDGSLRPCIDYRGLNAITVKNRYPLPLMSSAFEILQGAQFFTKLDLRNAYHLIRVKEGDEWKTAFNTPLGHFEYRVLPFGLVNAPAVFQALINDVLRDMLNLFVFVYLDDILIFSPTLQVHVQHVRQVLQRLLENRLFVKAEKCTFHAPTVTFLGSVISAQGISMDPVKVRAVIDWPILESRVALQRFLGFANFYRRFIRGFSQIAAPLTALTSVKSQFSWTVAAQAAFERLKFLFSSAPILITPDLERQFIVEVDASEVGVGAILSQRSPVDERIHPCAFFSHRLTPAERNYDVGNRELLAIRLALGEWRHWLEGSVVPFIVWTDHKNLEYIRSAKRLNARQARWSLYFTRFDFTISFRPGSKNQKPDALSRQFPSPETMPTEEGILPQGVIVGAAIWGIERLVKRTLSHTRTPRLCPKGLLFVPPSARRAVIQWGHSSKLFVHPGVRGTIAAVKQRFWWPSRERDIRRFIASCSICAQTKGSNRPPAGFLRPLPVPSRPWAQIALDFITGLPLSRGNQVILTVIDRFSKAAHFVPLPKLPSAKETAQVVVDHVFRIHGLPENVVSDRGPQFSSLFWKEFCRLIGASVSLSSGYHPQTNGQAERANQTIGRLLRCLAFRNPASWAEQLSWAEYAYNSAPASATGFSPFQSCLGYQPPLFPSSDLESKVPSALAFIQRCKRTWRMVRAALCKSRSVTLRAANKRRIKSPRYACGQRVWLSTANLPLQYPSRKLAPKFIGPFRVVRVHSPVAVRLRLPASLRRVHPVFHVSNLKPVVRAPPRPVLSPVRVEGAPIYRVRRLLDVRSRGRGHQFLVDWEGYGPEERCWIPSRDVLDRSLIDDFFRARQSSSGAPVWSCVSERIIAYRCAILLLCYSQQSPRRVAEGLTTRALYQFHSSRPLWVAS